MVIIGDPLLSYVLFNQSRLKAVRVFAETGRLRALI